MRIVIIGDGKVGNALTNQFFHDGHDVVVIDNNPDNINALPNTLDVMGVVGNGASYDVQKEAGVDESDLVIAATSSDEINVLCCFIASKLGAPHTIARVRNPEYNAQLEMMKEDLGLSMIINPERAAAREISRILRFPSANDIESFCRSHVELVEYKLGDDSPLCGMSLKDIYIKYHIKVLVCAVRRGDDITIPNGDFVLAPGDKINVTASPANIAAFFKAIGGLRAPVKSVMIVGGGKISYYLASQLLEMGMTVKIIDMDPEVCEELSQLLPRASIILGDATEKEFLLEEGINDFDAFVALTGFDEMNIIISMYASAKGVGKVISKVHRLAFPEVIEHSGIESVISPKLITASQISSYVRAMQNSIMINKVESLRRIIDNRVEALEFIIHNDASYVGIPLKDLHFCANILIAAIVRRGKVIIPGGNDCFERGDSVIVISTVYNLQDLSDVFM